LTEAMLADLAAFCARLPATSAPPSAFIDDLADIAQAFPARSPLLKAITAFIRPVLRALPSVARHGDLWSGNILIDRGRLAGIVDWDAWHPRGVPGTDLLHCLAIDTAHASGRELGSVWVDAPWRSSHFQRIATPYWAALDIWPNAATLQAVGIAWWAGYVAHSLACDPQLVGDARWTGANIDAVLSALERVIL
jgi:aminoglycoside phosphotransferase (APT) family kinase protein